MSNTKKPEITPEDRKKNLKRHGWSLLIGGFLTFVISAAITGSMGSWHTGEDTSKLNFIMILPLVTVIGLVCFFAGIIDLIRAAFIKTNK